MHYLFIINSNSNPKMLRKLEDTISALDDDLRMRIELKYTKYLGHATELATEASDAKGNNVTVVACGGDGTVHEVVNGLAYRSTPMVVVPIGRSNDFARTVLPKHLYDNPFKIIPYLDTINVLPIDLVRIDSYDVIGNHLPVWSEYFVNVASVGLDTEVLMLCNRKLGKRFKGHRGAHSLEGHKKVLRGNTYQLDYNLEIIDSDTPEVSEDEEFYSISICNGRYYGDGFKPAPDAQVDDGVVTICAVEKMRFWKSVKAYYLFKKGRHTDFPGVRMFKATSGIIKCKESSFQLFGNYDGELFYGHRLRFEVFPESLNMGFFK